VLKNRIHRKVSPSLKKNSAGVSAQKWACFTIFKSIKKGVEDGIVVIKKINKKTL
jgi:hypothetical protein